MVLVGMQIRGLKNLNSNICLRFRKKNMLSHIASTIRTASSLAQAGFKEEDTYTSRGLNISGIKCRLECEVLLCSDGTLFRRIVMIHYMILLILHFLLMVYRCIILCAFVNYAEFMEKYPNRGHSEAKVGPTKEK
jgi:hypothetical protein